MDDHRLWCWEAAQAAAGPDWHFIARVSPESTVALAALAGRAAPDGFARVATTDGAQEFIDTSNYDDYSGNLTGRQSRNIWVYNLVRFQGDTLEIQAGYGGRGEDLSRAETRLLHAILADAGVILVHWKVLAGGEGYEYRTLRLGGDGESLRAYLAK